MVIFHQKPLQVGDEVKVVKGKYAGRVFRICHKEGKWVSLEFEDGEIVTTCDDVIPFVKSYGASDVLSAEMKERIKDLNISIGDIADEIGKSKSVIYGYFKFKLLRTDHLELINKAIENILNKRESAKEDENNDVPEEENILDPDEKLDEVINEEVASMEDVDEEFEVLEDSNCVDESTQKPSDADSMMNVIVESLNIVEFCKLASMIVMKVEALNDVYKN